MIKWLYRLAWFCVIVGLAGSITIVVWMIRDTDEPQTQILLPVSGDSIIDLEGADKQDAAKVAINNDEATSESRGTKERPDNQILLPKKETPNTDEAEKPAAKATKLLTQDEQEEVLLDIQQALAAGQGKTNCIKIYRTNDESNYLIFLQIELLLKSHNFTIAGRETISGKRKGVQISFSNECLKLTVGSF